MNDTMNGERTWSVVLAGGEGCRMRDFVEAWLGHARPKQYCRFVGSRSMFQHTVDRADRFVSPETRVSVAARSHVRYVRSQLDGREPGRILFQPRNCGTAIGILLACAYVQHKQPDASVVIMPSDHFVHPEGRFVDAMREALRAVERIPEKLVLAGVVPDAVEPDYGWIEPGQCVETGGVAAVRSVRRFIEKPNEDVARRAMVSGCLWNTMVVAARVATLWALFEKLVPEAVSRFVAWQSAIGSGREEKALDAVYGSMRAADFSRDILQPSIEKLLVLELEGLTWSDWGRPERVMSSLARIGRAPAFSPIELAAVPAPAEIKLHSIQGG